MSKILLALQFWGDRKTGDWSDAMRLAKFIADLEPDFNQEIEFLFAARFDAKPDPRTVDYVSEKFDTSVLISPRAHAIGWPYGCNELWSAVILECHNGKAQGRYKDVDCVLTFEPDCVPLKRGWAGALHKAWMETKPAVMGAMSEVGPYKWMHVNGNLVADMNLLKRVPRTLGVGPEHAWDMLLAPAFKAAGWKHTDLIVNHYHKKDVPEDELKAISDGPAVFLHGVKDNSAFDFAKRLLG